MARALIVGCGCRGCELGRVLRDDGWRVRGTSRREDRGEEIAAAGIEPALADPDRVATLLELVADVTLVFWLLGSATGDEEQLTALHGPRLERLLAELVDTPVRGFVYEGAGSAGPARLAAGAEAVRAAAARWQIPVAVTAATPLDVRAWLGEMTAAARSLVGGAA